MKQFRGEVELPSMRAQSAPWWDGVQVAFFGIQYGKRTVLTNAEFAVQEDGEPIEPFTTLHRDQAQLLLDDLWNCGIRPSNGANNVGQLAATEKHLADMRKLVSHTTGAQL